jgi:poly(beta-D-mannuronate) lyase
MSVDISSLTTVLSKAQPGDTILLRDGTYNNLRVVIGCRGEQNKRITIKPVNPGKVILTGGSTITITGSYTTVANLVLKDGGVSGRAVVIQGTHNRVTGFDVSYSASNCEQMVRIENENNRVDHCTFHDWDKLGVWVTVWRPNSNANFAMIDHNIFKDRKATSANNGLECIRIGTSDTSLSSSKSIVYNNIFDNCNGEIEVISNKSGENIYYKNTMTSCEGTLTLRHGDKCYVYNNKFDQKNKENSGGVRITGEEHIVKQNLFKDINGNGTTRTGLSINNGVPNTAINGYYQVKNTQITDNTFINCLDAFAIGVRVKTECTLTPVSTTIANNIVYHSTNGECFSTNSSVLYGNGVTYSSNMMFASTLGKAPSTGVVRRQPTEFDLTKVDETLYGATEKCGPLWNILEPEQTELSTPIVEYYPTFLRMVTSDTLTQNTRPTTPATTPTPTPTPIRPPTTTPTPTTTPATTPTTPIRPTVTPDTKPSIRVEVESLKSQVEAILVRLNNVLSTL